MSTHLIQKLQSFTRLSEDDQRILIASTSERVRHFASRETIIDEGDTPAYINVFLEGWAGREKILDDGRRQMLAIFLPGDMCDANVFVLGQMDHSIVSVTRTVVAQISRETFSQIMAGRPRLAQAFWWDTLVASAVAREWVVNLGQRQAFERMAHLFCELFVRLQVVGLTSGATCDLPLTQQDLGEALGLSGVHVNRTLQELRGAELIELKGRRLRILDFEALKAAALFNPDYLHLEREGRHLDANE